MKSPGKTMTSAANPALQTRQYQVNVSDAATAVLAVWDGKDKSDPAEIRLITVVLRELTKFQREQGAWFRTLKQDGQQQLVIDIIAEVKKRIDANADNRGSRG
jgi:hypothetical protein